MASNQQFQASPQQGQQPQTIRNVVQQQGQVAQGGQVQQVQQVQQIQIANAQPQQQQFVTINGNQQVAVRVQPQVMQIPTATQQMVPVQIPVSQNGQTVYQTVQMPMAVPQPAVQTAMIPQVIQTSSGQQIVMQQVQIAQPQVQQQFAQILMPNGQLQQVQVVQPQQMFGTIGGLPQQIPIQTATANPASIGNFHTSFLRLLYKVFNDTYIYSDRNHYHNRYAGFTRVVHIFFFVILSLDHFSGDRYEAWTYRNQIRDTRDRS